MKKYQLTEKQTNETPKKEWITPEMEEMNVNGGNAYSAVEISGNDS